MVKKAKVEVKNCKKIRKTEDCGIECTALLICIKAIWLPVVTSKKLWTWNSVKS